MNILILHRMGNPRYWRKAVAELELALPTYAPEHNYIVHNAWLPFPDYLKEIQFHGIVLGPTFLCARYNSKEYHLRLKEFEFVKETDAFKVALPQDDYDCAAILDRWVTDWKVDKVYTVCPEHWDILYPNYLKAGGKLVLGYTGYISPDLINRRLETKPYEKRSIDVSYRASKLPANFGRMGYLKGDIGRQFQEAFKNEKLIMDISVRPEDTIPGSLWLDFIEDSRFTLGTNSGSSLFDPEGKIRECVTAFVRHRPDAVFEEIENNCFPNQDGKYIFTALSPRLLEAGLLRTGQILTPGPYSGVIIPWEHYIPMEEDFSDFSEVAKAIRDTKYVNQMTFNCRNVLLGEPKLRTENYVKNILHDIHEGVQKNHIVSNSQKFLYALNRYNSKISVTSKCYNTIDSIKRFLRKNIPFTENFAPLIKKFF